MREVHTYTDIHICYMNRFGYHISIPVLLSIALLVTGAGCATENNEEREMESAAASTTAQLAGVEVEEHTEVSMSPLLEKEIADMESRIEIVEKDMAALEARVIMEWEKTKQNMETEIASARETVRQLREHGDASSVELRSEAKMTIPSLRDVYTRSVSQLRTTFQSIVVAK